MTQYNSLNVQLSNSQLSKLKSAKKKKMKIMFQDYHQIWLVIQMIILIFLMNYC